MGFYDITEDSEGQYTTTGVSDASEVTDRNPYAAMFGPDSIFPVNFTKNTVGVSLTRTILHFTIFRDLLLFSLPL